MLSEKTIRRGPECLAVGGMQVGSIRGHGNYVAADWTADCLHREAMFTLEKSATAEFSKIDDGFDPPEDDAAIA